MDQTIAASFLSLPTGGELRGPELAKLLLKAGQEHFEGSLVVQASEQNKAAFRFINGNATRWFSSLARNIVTAVLGELLPPEQMSFVASHASHQGTDELSAIIRLGLLPEVALRRVHRDCTLGTFRTLMGAGSQLRYRFYPGQDYFAGKNGMNHPMDTLVLAAECMLRTGDVDWARNALQGIRLDPLALRGRVTNPDFELEGPLRQVVSALRRQPASFDALRLRRILSEEALVACIYALAASDNVIIHRGQGARTSGAPLGSSSLAPGAAPEGPVSMGPPRSGVAPAGSRGAAAPHSGAPRTTVVGPGSLPAQPPHSSGAVSPAASSRAPHPPFSQAAPASTRSPSSSALPAAGTHGPASRSTTSPNGPTSSPHSVMPRDENAVEASAMDAWMKSVADPACAPRALAVAERAAERFPENARILFYYGCLLARNDQKEQAETAMRRVLKLDPDHIEAQYELKVLQKHARSQSQTRPALMGLFGSKKSNSG